MSTATTPIAPPKPRHVHDDTGDHPAGDVGHVGCIPNAVDGQTAYMYWRSLV